MWSDFLDTAIWTKEGHLTQVTPIRFPLCQEFAIGMLLAQNTVKNDVKEQHGRRNIYIHIHSFILQILTNRLLPAKH